VSSHLIESPRARSRSGRIVAIAGLAVASVLALFQLVVAIRFLANADVGFSDVTSIVGGLVSLADELSPDASVPFMLKVALGVLAAFGIGTATLSAWILWKADADLPVIRLVAGLLLAVSALGAIVYFFDGLARFEEVSERFGEMVPALEFALTVYILLGFARFACIFPRAVDGEAVRRAYFERGWRKWLRRRADQATLMPAWHRGLVNGRVVLVGAPLAAVLALGLRYATVHYPWDGWGGIWTTVILVAGGAYVLFGLPYAYASLAHLLGFGEPDERARVARLRGIFLALLILYSVATLAWIPVSLVPGTPNGLAVASLLLLLGLWTLLPQVLVLCLAWSVLPGGELDPRLAFTRITAWSLLGIVMTVGFLVVERVLALRLAGWFGMSPNTGAVMAGAFVATGFVPLRGFLTARMDRLAHKLIPLEMLAAGEQVERAVLITDLSGYTALSATDEAAARLQSAALSRLGDSAATRIGGRLVKSLGDAVMLLLPSAEAALQAARSIHEQYPRAANALAIAPLGLHSAIHAGSLVEARDGDIFGQTVNITARMVNAATAGEIVLSAEAKAKLSDSTGFESMGEQRFKNVPAPVHCYRWRPGSGSS
jgi:class 3 adenylate cyclase